MGGFSGTWEKSERPGYPWGSGRGSGRGVDEREDQNRSPDPTCEYLGLNRIPLFSPFFGVESRDSLYPLRTYLSPLPRAEGWFRFGFRRSVPWVTSSTRLPTWRRGSQEL